MPEIGAGIKVFGQKEKILIGSNCHPPGAPRYRVRYAAGSSMNSFVSVSFRYARCIDPTMETSSTGE
ncbi:hypothetical protein FM107_03395 [Sphingobacterium sp. JB170]|nr:hypothetical protein FM107_03395 [Sphingobacterium sp. JB170]